MGTGSLKRKARLSRITTRCRRRNRAQSANTAAPSSVRLRAVLRPSVRTTWPNLRSAARVVWSGRPAHARARAGRRAVNSQAVAGKLDGGDVTARERSGIARSTINATASSPGRARQGRTCPLAREPPDGRRRAEENHQPHGPRQVHEPVQQHFAGEDRSRRCRARTTHRGRA